MRRQFRFEVGPSEPAGAGIRLRLRRSFSTIRIAGMILCMVALGCLVGCGGGGGSSNQAPPPANPNPSLATGSLNPSSAVAGGPSFTLTVTGTNFISSSTVQWNGSVRATTFVSSASLQAAITAADIATPGTAQVSVLTPGPGGGSTSMLTFTINNPNPVPTVASLTPSSAVAGGLGFALTVTGANFILSSTVQWNGSARTTTFVAGNTLQAAITAADIAMGGTNIVTVSTPTPGGGTSSTLTFTVNDPVPTAASLNPNSAFAGDIGFTLTVTGTNFVPSSKVQWNGSARATTFVSSTSLQAAITAGDINAVGMAMVTVSTPAPGGGSSAALTFTIKVPPLAITLLAPSSAVAGGPAFTLTVTGTNFIPTSTVLWNGSARATTFVSSTSLQAAITAADIAAIGVAKVTVSNPGPNGGNSAASTFFIGATGGPDFAVIAVNQAAQDIVFDRKNQVFYLSVTGTDANHPNTISVLDPATGTITLSQTAGSNPNVLAISDDSQFLYAGIDGAASVQRFTLPGLAKDISYSLGSDSFGPNFALGLQVAPGAAHTTAVTLANVGVSPSAQGGITIFDDATARPTKAPGFGGAGGGLFDSIQWGADATALFAANNEDTGFDFYTLTVNPSGVTLSQDFQSDFSSFANRIHFDAGTKLIYAEEGHVINPSTGLPAGNFNISGVMVPDSALNTAFFASSGSNSATIESFDLTHFTPISSITIPNVNGGPIRLIRWGQNGLAFNTGGFGVSGQVYLVGGNFVSPAPPFTLTSPPTPTPPPTPAANAPKIASLNPSSAIAGGLAFTLTVTGTNFVPTSAVEFNGSALTTTFVSSTQLTATITSLDIATPSTANITVANPTANGGVSAASTFFIGSSGGSSSKMAGFAVAMVNQSSRDIVFDPTHQEIFLSVPSSNASGNSISVLDLATTKIVGEQFAGSNPHILAISDDDQFLYAGIEGSSSVQRFTLPGLGTDINYSLGSDGFFGPQFALDLGAAPGAPHTTAVALGSFNVSPNAQAGITVFDDATPRPTKDSFGGLNQLQWGSDASTLFATGEFGSDLFTLSVSSTGVVQKNDFANALGSSARFHFDAGTKLIYSDGGRAVDPSTGLPVGNFNISGLMVPDSTLNKAFFLTGSGSPTVTITSFDLKLFTQIDSITVNSVTGNPQRLIRWGQNGLAFNTDGGQVFLMGGNFVH
jgi:hypothetical protein